MSKLEERMKARYLGLDALGGPHIYTVSERKQQNEY